MYFGYFSNRILERGRTYFLKNRVFSIQQLDANTYSAIVLGNEPYHVSLRLNKKGNIVEAHCDCPYARDGNHCKHEAALYYALQDRLMEKTGLCFDVKKVYSYCQRTTYSDYSLNYQFSKELDKYLKQVKRMEINDGVLSSFQETFDDFVALRYPASYRDNLMKKLMNTYFKIMKIDDNNLTWLQRSLCNDQYQTCFSSLVEIVQMYPSDQQLSLLQAVLSKKANEKLLSLYIRLLIELDKDVLENLKDLADCQHLGLYHYELIRYYLLKNDSKQIKKQYQVFLNDKKACTPYYLSKIDAILFDDKKDHFFDYVCRHCRIYDYQEVLHSYEDLKDTYGDDRYPVMFLKDLENRIDQYFYCQVLNGTGHLEMLMMNLFDKSNMEIFDDHKKRLQDFDQPDYFLLYVNSLLEHMQYVKTAKDYQIAQQWFDELFNMIEDPLTKIEIAQLFMNKYPKRKKIRDIVESYLDDRGIQ